MTARPRSSSGDVFEALGFSAAESKDLRLRSDLMIELKNQIIARRKPQAEIAKLLSITQPRVSNLLQGRIDLFSLNSLVGMLERLGNHLEIAVVRDKDTDIPETEVCVRYAFAATTQVTWGENFRALSAGIKASLSRSEDSQSRVAADKQYALVA